MIPQETVSLILDTAKIEEVVGEYVTLKRRGANLTACCPFHNEKTPSFYVSPSKGIYKCFGCGASGGVVNFVIEQEHCTYVEALRWLAAKYRIEIQEEELSAEQLVEKNRRESLFLVSDFAMKWYAKALDTPEGRAVGRAYLRQRGLSDETVSEFCIGWAPKGRTGLVDAAIAEGYKTEYLIDAGLAIKNDDGSVTDRFRERVMFPVFNLSGRVIAFSGRTLHADNPAKYVNSPETQLYKKSSVLLGIKYAKNAISKEDKCILVEGNLDMVSLYQLGLHNVVAPCGTALTPDQVRLIGRFTQNVTVMFDGDSAGIHAALKSITIILKEGMNVRIVLLPDGEDPDSFSKGRNADELREYIVANEQNFVNFQADMLLKEAGEDPDRRADVINSIVDTIALISDSVKRSIFVRICAERFSIAADIIEDRIISTRRNIQREHIAEQERAQRRIEAGLNPVVPGEDSTRQVNTPVRRAGLEELMDNPLLAPTEQDLLGFMLRFGTEPMEFESDSAYYAGENEEMVTVADFISNSLDSDGIGFVNSVLRKTYEAYLDLYDQGYGRDEMVRSMLNSEDRSVSKVVGELAFEKHDLNVKSFREALTATSSWLVKHVPHTIILYAGKRLEYMVQMEKNRLATTSDAESQVQIMENIMNLQRQINIVKKKLTDENK